MLSDLQRHLVELDLSRIESSCTVLGICVDRDVGLIGQAGDT
jgi:hypothetical protein